MSTECYVVDPTPDPLVALATQQTWPQVWAVKNLQYVACNWYGTPLYGSCSTSNASYAALLNSMKTKTLITDMNAQLQSVCAMAKDNNVIVYGIAFEAPTNGQTQIRNCSTDNESGAHYFNASGLQIATAFSAIANNISQLRLTQ